MVFRPQPQKKAKAVSATETQECVDPSCVHRGTKHYHTKLKSESGNVLKFPSEKNQINDLQNKIKERFKSDARAFEKSALILSSWLNTPKKK